MGEIEAISGFASIEKLGRAQLLFEIVFLDRI
jgi:hypothetical protein